SMRGLPTMPFFLETSARGLLTPAGRNAVGRSAGLKARQQRRQGSLNEATRLGMVGRLRKRGRNDHPLDRRRQRRLPTPRPRAPGTRALSRFMDEHWRSATETRGIESWDSIAYPANSPLTRRPDWREADADADPVKAAQATLDRFGFAHAILNCLFSVQ